MATSYEQAIDAIQFHGARNVLIAIADEFQNHYLTYEGFANLNGLAKEQAAKLIDLAQTVRQSKHPEH